MSLKTLEAAIRECNEAFDAISETPGESIRRVVPARILMEDERDEYRKRQIARFQDVEIQALRLARAAKVMRRELLKIGEVT